MSFACPSCRGVRLHHSRLRNPFERIWWRTTGVVPWRCEDCGTRSWHRDRIVSAGGLRHIHPALTEIELDKLDAGVEGERT